MTTLTASGRRVRAALTLVCALLLLAGTFWGDDDEFPFGPFRMYASAPDPDSAAGDTRVEGVDPAGRVIVLTEGNSGIRRAEIEGQLGAYRADPARMSRVSDAYVAHTPGAPPLREVRIVTRWHEVQDSRPVGHYRDEVVVRWVRP